MKKIRYVLGISLLLPVFASAPVLAESTSGSSGKPLTSATGPALAPAKSDSLETTPPTTTVASTQGAGSDDASQHGKIIGTPSTDPTQMKKRLEELKTEQKVHLDDATKKKIVLKCKPAQTIVEGAEKSDFANGKQRDETYKKITDNLTSLIARLKANGVDTTALAAAETTLEAKIATFNTDMTKYQQTITDLHGLDCITDPTAFQAALLAARTQRDTVKKDATDIRTFITTTLKPALEAVKVKLKPEDSTKPTDTTTTTDKTKATTTTGGKQ